MRLDEAVHVYIRISFLGIGDIDTKAQQFNADVLVEARWADEKIEKKGKSKKYDGYDPELLAINLIECREQRKWYVFEPGWVHLHWKISGKFYEKMELQSFPRDVQDIGVSISSMIDAELIELHVDDTKTFTLNRKAFKDDQEWHLFSHVEKFKVPEIQNSPVQLEHTAGHIQANCRVLRKSGFFLWNSVIMMVSLLLQSFTIFSLPVNAPARLANGVALLLVAVAFKLSAAGSLPQLSYLTYLDLYILAGLMYLCMIVMYAAGISSIFEHNPDFAIILDKSAMSFFAAILLIFHIAYGIFFVYKTQIKIRKMHMLDEEYRAEVYGVKNEHSNISLLGSVFKTLLNKPNA